MGKQEGVLRRTAYETPLQTLSVFQQRLPIDGGQLHFLVPAGVGDNLWIAAKHWTTVEDRDVTFWIADSEQKRSGDLFRMLGWKYGYMPGLTTDWIWSQPGEPPIPDTGAVLSMQPNRHLENGHRIEKWYADYTFRNPVELLKSDAALFRLKASNLKYVVVFTSTQGYMEDGGNLLPAQWARICRQLEKDVAPVVLIGAGRDVPFVEKICQYFDPQLAPVFNAPLDQVYTLFAGATMVVGAHAGPLILSTYMGIPTLHAYPRWLHPMPGTWEAEGNVWGACFLDELENRVREGVTFCGNNDMGRMKAEAEPQLKIYTSDQEASDG